LYHATMLAGIRFMASQQRKGPQLSTRFLPAACGKAI
jgi:hypothetical protein